MKKSNLKVSRYNIKHRNIFTVSCMKFEYKKQSVSFCILCCITNFTVRSCTIPVLNYQFERDKVFEQFYMVR